jgi:D-alanyl-D-alanine endopeptidase (penicillin-binding protein 7)
MDLLIKSLKNVVKILLIAGVFSFPAYSKKSNKPPVSQNAILATNYIVQDLDTGEIITEKNSLEIRSIASITKLMTAVVVLDSHQDLSEVLLFKKPKGMHSRLPDGALLTRSELLLLSLMSSDNVAAKLLAQNYAGGEEAAISAMNAKAASLGMPNTHFTDPTGLLNDNVSTAQDLSKLINYAYNSPIIREYSTKSSERIEVPGRKKSKFFDFHTTNSLVVKDPNIGLSKTGWIRSAGGCLVMIVKHQGHRLAVILLNSRNTHTRIRDGVLLTEYNNGRHNRNFGQFYTTGPSFK